MLDDAIRFITAKQEQQSKQKLTMSSKKEHNDKESKEPDYDNEDREELEEEQEEETVKVTTNHIFYGFLVSLDFMECIRYGEYKLNCSDSSCLVRF